MKVQIEGQWVQEALQLLADTYPGSAVDIWCGVTTEGAQTYTAFIRVSGSSESFSCGSPVGAAAEVCRRVNPEIRRLDRIANLRAELAELEAQL